MSRHFTKIADGMEVSEIIGQLEQHPELWNQVDYRKVTPGTPHAEMSDIWVHYNDFTKYEKDKRGLNDEHDAVWYPAAYEVPALKKAVFDVMRLVEGERLGFVLITKIPPGGVIYPHRDAGWHVDYFDKFYLSLKSNPKAGFYCEEETLFPRSGELWRFDNRRLHWVKNEGDEERMTLIVCIRTEKYEQHPQLGGVLCRQVG